MCSNKRMSEHIEELHSTEVQQRSCRIFSCVFATKVGSIGITVVGGMLVTVAQTCPNITTLDLSECKVPIHRGIEALALNCKHLISIDLSGRSGVLSDSNVFVLALSCTKLLIIIYASY